MTTPPPGSPGQQPYGFPPQQPPQYGQYPPYGQQPQQPYPPQPVPPAPAPSPARSRWNFGCVGWGVIVVCLAIVVGLVVKFFFLGGSDTSPRHAKVGDCVHAANTAPGSKVEKVKCSDATANYTVAKRYEYDGLIGTRSCQDVPGATFRYHGQYYTTVHHHRITHTYLLCLTPRNGTSGNPAPTGRP
ncbi:hypothetical protein K2224_32170 (plasmid) [Streptomyces sp. BHT-5-2]|uniref:LppU/SCO3897 family protein n=1 Tax=unclassified Streptomyces TaxID=2593676 RepID=UPI001C8DBD15|nr:hypothetical protein [Streptomyces sp. BHT-5-2]QZL07861.1 hypothetical protein K2224_32170 [Streptomyces sp. BHT-5-2]